jgi:hypothetical protein
VDDERVRDALGLLFEFRIEQHTHALDTEHGLEV